ncbi:hypothetical protein KVT40_005926 [Elsinoe batatas]|uniref:GLEYA adhesin domain-containing protein n=1 Tax=Elsinoe batatas TaxID=2601811 RepID=A0A8K0KZD6_9PEZI|nr:hypothetical protein KVT40_005926 [Elsinoe batatas]
MADRFSKSAALMGLLVPFVHAAPVDQVAAPATCSAAATSIASALKANPTADALCAKLLNLDNRVVTTTVTPDTGFTSTTVVPIVTDTLTVTAPTSLVTVTATVETCTELQKRAAPTNIRKAIKSKAKSKAKSKIASKVKSAKGSKITKLPKVTGKKSKKAGIKTAKNNLATKVKSVKGTKKVLPTTSAGRKKKVVSKAKSAASKIASKVKSVNGASITFGAGSGIAQGTKISAGVPGVITASAEIGVTQTISISGKVYVTVITPSVRPTISSVFNGVRTIQPPAVTTPAPNFALLSCSSAPAELQANPCELIGQACGCASLPASQAITITAFPADVPTITRYNSIAITYTSVPLASTTVTVTATGCPSIPQPTAGSGDSNLPQPGNDDPEDNSTPSTRQAIVGATPAVSTSALTTPAPAVPTACDNSGVEWAVYSIANSIMGNQKRQLPIGIDTGLGSSGNGVANGGISIYTSEIKATASAAAAGARSSAVAIVTTVSGKVVTLTSYVAVQATNAVSSANSLGGFLTSVAGAAQASAAAGVSSLRADVNGQVSSGISNAGAIRASATSIVGDVRASATSLVGAAQASAAAGVSSIRDEINGQISSGISNAGAIRASATSIVGDIRASATSIVGDIRSSAISIVGDAQASANGIRSSVIAGAGAATSAIRASVTSIVNDAQATVSGVRGSANAGVAGAQSTISSIRAAATSLRGEIPAQIASARAAVQTTILGIQSDALARLTPVVSGISGGANNAKDTATSAPSVVDALKTNGTALVQRAYLLAPETGTYTFLLKSAADQALLWVGAAATRAFSDANIVCVANLLTQGTCSYVVDLQQGDYLPYKVLLEHGTGKLNDFDFTVSGPGGDIIQNNVNVMPQNVVRFGCSEDAVLAPVMSRL